MTDAPKKKSGGTRFSGIVGRTPPIDPEPPEAPEAASVAVETPMMALSAPAPTAPVAPPISAQKPRPLGKKADRDNYTQVTVYLRKDVYKTARKLLIDDDKQVSDLVDELITRWIADRQK